MATSVGSFVLFSNYLSPLHSTPTHESAAQLQKVGLPLQSKRHHGWVKQLSKWTSGLSTARSDSSRLKSTGLWTILQVNSAQLSQNDGQNDKMTIKSTQVIWTVDTLTSKLSSSELDGGPLCPMGFCSKSPIQGGGCDLEGGVLGGGGPSSPVTKGWGCNLGGFCPGSVMSDHRLWPRGVCPGLLVGYQ